MNSSSYRVSSGDRTFANANACCHAEALGKENDLGTVQRGKLADILILDADPLIAVRNLRKIHLVVQNGNTYAPEALFQQARKQANTPP